MLVYDLTMDEHQAAIAEITCMLAANSLVHSIAATFPLDKIVEAHQTVESGKAIGNVVLRIG
jgi:NADPH2:quinone reductase